MLKNLLNVKRPMFWIIFFVTVFLIVFMILLNLEKESKLTVEDYANEYVDEIIRGYEEAEYQYFKVIEHKITALEKLAVYENILNHPVELWAIEYRLKPDNMDNVLLAGGMNEEDGWITEDSSAGNPVLVFSILEDRVEWLGVIWTEQIGETVSSQEVALRAFLQTEGYLPQVFFPGDHVLVKFSLSTGETAQAFLSQPIKQGSTGIWAVEKWMDGNGIIYYHDPQVDQTLLDYYFALQEQCDHGHQPWLLNAEEVALDFVTRILGQPLKGDLEILTNASIEDFLQSPISTYIGHISNFSEEFPNLFHFDAVEWLTLEDTERMEELGISSSDMPNGYYIHNPIADVFSFEVMEETEYIFYDWGNNFVSEGSDIKYTTKDKEEFIQYLNTYLDKGEKVPFWIETKDGYVIKIMEQFVN